MEKKYIIIAGVRYNPKGPDVPCYWQIDTDLPIEIKLINYYKIVNMQKEQKCSTAQTTSIFVSGSDVYVAGYYYNKDYIRIACYWRNGTKIDLKTYKQRFAQANSIWVEDKYDEIYVAGQYNRKACYWLNGIRTDLKSSGMYGEANSIYVVTEKPAGAPFIDTTIHITGIIYDNAGKCIACYWKDGIRTDLAIERSIAYSIFVSGSDVYVSGQYYNGSKWIACYWKNGTRIDLSEDLVGFGNSIYVYGSDVYVAGFYWQDPKTSIACYWKNGVKFDLEGESASARSILVDEQDIHVIGIKSNWYDGHSDVYYWKNNKGINLTSWSGEATGIAIMK